MKISVVAILAAAVAGVSAMPMPMPMPMPNGPIAALEGRASDAISNVLSYFRRDDGTAVQRRARAKRQKVDVRVVGRTFSFPVQDAGNGGGN